MYIYEFLFRGRHDSENESPAWHVVLGDVIETMGKTQFVFSNPLTPNQATEMGFDIKTILTNINTSVLADNEKLRGENEKLNKQISDIMGKLSDDQKRALTD